MSYLNFLQKAKDMFLGNYASYAATAILNGVNVTNKTKMTAVAGNTFRGFHRLDKNSCGVSVIFKTELSRKLPNLINQLKKVCTREELDAVSHSYTEDFRNAATANTKASQLKSYNKCRKIIDLLVEHLVAMSIELKDSRETLVPLLFLPLDSEIFQKAMTEDERADQKIKNNFSYGSIKTKAKYDSLQRFFKDKADAISKEAGQPCYAIYFDLLWRDRQRHESGNLFQRNL